MSGTQLWGLLSAFGVTLLVLYAAVRLLKRLHWTPRAKAGRVPLRVLQQVALGPKQSVAILQVADRALVISTGEGGARLLTEITGETAGQLLASLQEAKPAAVRRPFASSLSRLLGVRIGALLLAGFLLAGAVLAGALTAETALAQGPGPGAGTPASSLARPGGSTAPAASSVSMPVPPRVEVQVGEGNNALRLSGTVGLVVAIGLMTLLPALFLLMTSFTRILIVLQFLRPALGTQSAPPAQLLAALAILLTGVVMNPVLQEANQVAVQPLLRGEITQTDAYRLGVQPFREFMLANTRDKDLAMFTELSGATEAASYEEVPTVTLVSAFVTSELRTSFQMGFLIFLPFVVLDVIIASVLMSLGMFMLPPMMVSLPFKLLLFVIADGWGLVIQNLVLSFRH